MREFTARPETIREAITANLRSESEMIGRYKPNKIEKSEYLEHMRMLRIRLHNLLEAKGV